MSPHARMLHVPAHTRGQMSQNGSYGKVRIALIRSQRGRKLVGEVVVLDITVRRGSLREFSVHKCSSAEPGENQGRW